MANINTEGYEKTFDKAIKNRGGRYDLELVDDNDIYFALFTFKDSAQSFINNSQKRVVKGGNKQMPYVHFDYINSTSFNAAAFRYEGKEFIGVNYGVVLTLMEVFNRMLARNDIFLEIGVPDQEINPDPIPHLTKDFSVIQDFYRENGQDERVMPKDPIRINHAAELTNFVLEFLLHHELAHLRYGHYDYFHNSTGLAFILEFDANVDKHTLPKTNCVIEWHADCWAAWQSVHRLKQKIAHPAFLEEIRRKYTSVEYGAYFNWGLAIWVLFRLMEQTRSTMPSLSKYYPSPKERLFNAVTLVSSRIDESMAEPVSLKSEDNTKGHIMMHIYEEAERALTLVSNEQQPFGKPFMIGNNKENNTYKLMTEYLTYFKDNLLSELEPLSRSGDLDLNITFKFD